VADTYHSGPFTGSQPLPGAPEGLIVGDSHIVAYSVRDQDAMGANPFVYFQF
jgi:hypothetical protein